MPNKNNFDLKSIIFDLDDTLYPQIEFTRECLMATAPYIAEISKCSENKIKDTLNTILDKNGIEYKKTFNDLFDEIGFDGMSYIKQILEKFWDCNPQIYLFDGVLGTLNELKKDYKLCMLTDGYEKIQDYKIRQLGLSEIFDYILITDSLGVENRKPSSVPYQKLISDIQLSPKECIYVGNDPRKDFIACHTLKMPSIRVRQGDYKNITLDKLHEADFEISKIGDILNLLNIIKSNTGVING